MPQELWFIIMDHKDRINSPPRRKMARLYLGLANELETRWQATELQRGDFIATSNKLSAIDRWDKQCAINR